MLFHFLNSDKIYEARHKLLNLHPEPIVQAKIPTAYFSSFEQDFNSSALVEILSSVPNSPLTPGLQNFTPTFPNPNFSNKIGNRVQDFSNLTPANLRFHAMQQQSLQQNNKNNTSDLLINEIQTFSNISPRSMNANTSGYLSQLSHMGSLNISGSSNSMEHANDNALNNLKPSENQIVLGTPTNIMSRHLNERDIRTFEVENHLMTPVYHTVGNYTLLIVTNKINDKESSNSPEQ